MAYFIVCVYDTESNLWHQEMGFTNKIDAEEERDTLKERHKAKHIKIVRLERGTHIATLTALAKLNNK